MPENPERGLAPWNNSRQPRAAHKPMLGVRGTRTQGRYERIGKRCVDFCLAAIGLVVLALPMLVVAGSILVSSGWPVLFRQPRVGRHGRLFPLYKFRTMLHQAESGSSVTTASDPRTTRIGKFLRRHKVDELPQLWNVLTGDMSLVGPRPDVPGFADLLTGDARRILELRPGITGPASLFFADEEQTLDSVSDKEAFNRDVIFPEKVRLNLAYANHITLAGDLGYLLQTLRVLPRRL
jgi:lipopolysaccharide/colanic/teichoic acid biosynthesis glycosyltransferase